MSKIENQISTILDEVRELRHDLHRYPELGYTEKRTAQVVRDFILAAGDVEIQTGIAETGMVVLLGKDRPGPCVAIRADMDALPIEEEGDVEWKSTIPGKMHACGHDGHTAMLAGAARILIEREAELEGPVKLIFQPAEEGGGGALRMVEEGVLNDPPVAAIYGLHNNLPDPSLKIGQILYSDGPALAGTGTFDIEVIGKGGHAAFPHKCVDPLYIGSAIVQQLQGIVSRTVNPLDSAVVSVTRFHCGTANNIIAGKAFLHGTFRALSCATLTQLRDGIIQRAKDVASAHGAEVRIRCETGYPTLVNDKRPLAVFREILKEMGEEDRLATCDPIMGGEDFAYFSREVPGFFYHLPACPPDKELVPMCHHPLYDFNDDLLATGVRLHTETALRFARLWTG